MIPWNPCLKHDWEPVPDSQILFRCKKHDCKVLGYQAKTTSPHPLFQRSHTLPIQPYKCTKCDNPTQEKGKQCPACRAIPRNDVIRTVDDIQPTPKQIELLQFLADQNDQALPKHFAPGQVVGSLHKQGLLKAKQITVWSLSQKGKQLLERLRSEGMIPPDQNS